MQGGTRIYRTALRFLGIDITRDQLNGLALGALRILLILIIAELVIRAGRRVIGRLENRVLDEDRLAGRGVSRSRTLAGVSRSALGVVVWTLAVLQILQTFTTRTGSIIAGAGIAGIALGFGAQSLVRDFLTGFFVLLEDQYAVGDFIEVEDARGIVERFNLRLTSIRATDGTLHHIANGQIKMVGNSSAGWTKAIVDITVEFDEDIDRVEQALTRAADEIKDLPEVGSLVLGPAEILGVESLADGNLVMRVAIKTAPGSRLTVARAFRARVKKVFAEQGISVPTPHSILIQQPPPPSAEPDVRT